MDRRNFLRLGVAAGCSLLLPGCKAAQGPLKNITFSPDDYRRLPLLGLATTLAEEFSFAPRIEGTIPAGLQGVLFRNGPGRFDRDGERKRCLLDGDGMVQSFRLVNGKAFYRNRFVRTKKYREESAADKYLYSTWSTQAPNGFWKNVGGGHFANQAGIRPVVRDGRLFAFDEFQPPYELQPDTLETVEKSWLGLDAGQTVFSAHNKIDPITGDWIFYGLDFGRNTILHLTVLGSDGRLKKHQVYALPRFAYVHDFFVTDRHIILNLHPIEMDTLGFLLGMKSLTGALRWAPEKGNLVLVFSRRNDDPPLVLKAEAAWMWHSLNAYVEKSGNIVADFIGYRNPDHFLGKDPALFAIMEGRMGNYKFPGELRRYHIDPAGKTLREEVLHPGNFEFPWVDHARIGYRHRFGFFARIPRNSKFFTAVSRFDFTTGQTETFDFGAANYCSEPVFVAAPGSHGREDEPGWILTEVYDGTLRKSTLAVLDAGHLASGPMAKVHLDRAIPLGFHGFWQPVA